MQVDIARSYEPGFLTKWFWEIIEKANGNEEELKSLLSKLSRYELVTFCGKFNLESTSYFRGVTIRDSISEYSIKLLELREVVNKLFYQNFFDERDMTYLDAVITDWTWDIIARAKGNRATLNQILANFNQGEFLRFKEEFEGASIVFRDDTFSDRYEFGSEDDIEDISCWIVSNGKDYCYKIWQNPELTPTVEGDEPEDLHWVADQVYRKRFGENIKHFEDRLYTAKISDFEDLSSNY
jgi:hypothetical protein